MWRKFLGLLDAAWVARQTLPEGPLGRCGSDTLACFAWQPWMTMAAMWMHRSQFVWCGEDDVCLMAHFHHRYRVLFVLFSRYTYINTLTLMQPTT